MNKKISLGKKGEELAKQYLEKNKYKIIETNFRTKLGEIDIIAKQKEEIIFIEVKTRTSNLFGEPIEAINKKKQITIQKVAQCYLEQKDLKNQEMRIDAIEVIIKNNTEIRHTKGII